MSWERQREGGERQREREREGGGCGSRRWNESCTLISKLEEHVSVARGPCHRVLLDMWALTHVT